MRTRQWILGGILLMILMGGQSWLTYHLFTRHTPGGNDFYPRWANGCALLWNGENPYSAAVMERTQIAMHGHPASQPGEDRAAFAYPLYSLFFFAPLCLIREYALVQAIWMTLMFYALLGGVALALNLSGWQPPLWLLGLTYVWAVLTYPHARALLLGQIATLLFLALLAALWALEQRHDLWAGVLLSVLTLKPQLGILILPWLLWWAAWQRRWDVWRGFLGALAFLLLASLALLPTWIGDFLHGMRAYGDSWNIPIADPLLRAQDLNVLKYKSIISALVRLALHWPVAVEVAGLALGALTVLALAWRYRHSQGQTFLWITAWIVTLTHFITPIPATTHYSTLVLPLFLIFAFWQRRAPRSAPWLCVAGLGISWGIQWYVFLTTLYGSYETMWAFFPLPLLILGLQWTHHRRMTMTPLEECE